MNPMVIQNLKRQMDWKAKHQNMNSNFVENQDVDQKVYDTPNKGTILWQKSLQTKEQHVRH